MEIFKPNSMFDFSKISLANPKSLQPGIYFTKINTAGDKPLYFQLPKCVTKQGIITTARDKYCDLMYDQSTNAEFMDWIENLEKICRDKIMEQKHLWFDNELSRDEVETMMLPIVRLYKSNKYILLRAYISVNKILGKDSCIVYNEREESLDLAQLDVEKTIIPLILIDGIKFTSKSFEVDIKLIQIMVFDREPVLASCLIKPSGPNRVEPPANELSAPSLSLAEETSISDEDTINDTIIIAEPQVLGIEEINLDYSKISDTIKIKKPNEIYYKVYIAARKKAKYLRKIAMDAFLEAKEIKTTYMLDDIDNSDDEQ